MRCRRRSSMIPFRDDLVGEGLFGNRGYARDDGVVIAVSSKIREQNAVAEQIQLTFHSAPAVLK